MPQTTSPQPSSNELHLVCGAGGSRAVLASTGVALACHFAGIREYKSIGGTSGGSIPAIMLASGVDPTHMAATVIEIDFLSLFSLKVNKFSAWWAYFIKECTWRQRNVNGVFGSEKLGAFVDGYAPTWPDKFWTLAVDSTGPLLFCKSGIYGLSPDGVWMFLKENNFPPSIAIRATSARPGIIEAVYDPTWGDLQDGGLYKEGRCPAFVPKLKFVAAPNTIIACDVGEDSQARKQESAFIGWLRKTLCGPCCDPIPEDKIDFSDTIYIKPAVSDVRSLQLTLSPDQKWVALMDGFSSALCPLNKAGLLKGDKLEEAMRILHSFELLARSDTTPNELCRKARRLLRDNGLYGKTH